jgi:Glycosyl transferase family 2
MGARRCSRRGQRRGAVSRRVFLRCSSCQRGEENIIISQQLRGRLAAAIGPTLREIVVVVPAHNERERLPACLASVAAAARQATVPVTVVVVLDACTDRPEDAIARPVRALSVSGRNVGAARAAGFAAAAPRSDARTWLATTDADSVVPTTWLADQAVHHRALVPGCCRHGIGGLAAAFGNHTATLRPALPCPQAPEPAEMLVCTAKRSKTSPIRCGGTRHRQAAVSRLSFTVIRHGDGTTV